MSAARRATKGASLVHLSLDEIARRISAHLHRMERDPKINTLIKSRGNMDLRRFWQVSAGRHGSYVGVTYVGYQGSSNMTRDEALSYLAGLDGGYTGRHHEWLRQHPIVKPEAPVRYTALVSWGYGGFALFAITKTTKQRIYGHVVPDEVERFDDGRPPRNESITKDRIIKRQATRADLDAARATHEKRAEAEDQVHHEYRQAMHALFPEARQYRDTTTEPDEDIDLPEDG